MSRVTPLHQHQEDRVTGAPIAPANVEAEAAFLGAALIDNQVVMSAGALKPEHFYAPIHGRIFAAIVREVANRRTTTALTLKPLFEDDEGLSELGGASYLARLTGDGQGLLAPRELAEQIQELAARRERLNWLETEKLAASDLRLPLTDLTPPTSLDLHGGPIPTLDLAKLATIDPTAKAFIVPRIAPAGEVTLFTGAGAVGKSLLAQQLATAVAAGTRTLGLELAEASAAYLTCEDDPEQLHWRQVHICRLLGIEMASLSGKLHLASLRGEIDNSLAWFSSDGRMSATPLYARLMAMLRSAGCKLVVLDNVAHLFTGNENDRAQVTSFINMLNRAAGETGAAILLMGHPNKGGDSYSGSTAWLNAVRSQVIMGRDTEECADPDVRTLTIGKPNYTQAGEVLRFRWHEWAFVRDEELPADTRAELDATIRDSGDNVIFLDCLAERTRQKRAVSDRYSATYAPKVFAEMPESKRIGQKRLEGAMDRLFRTGQIERAELWKGSDRKWVSGLRTSAGDPAGDPAGNTVREPRETARKPAESRAGDAGDTLPYTYGIGGGALVAPAPTVTDDEEVQP